MEDNGRFRIEECLKGYRWKHYDQALRYNELYSRYVTGVDLDEELKRLEIRTDEETWKAIIKIVKHVCPSVCENAISIFTKGTESSGNYKTYKYEDKSDSSTEKINDITKILDGFFGYNTVDDYMRNIIVSQSFIDPNAYLLIDFKSPERDELTNALGLARPYPVIINCKDMLNREYENNTLEWAVFTICVHDKESIMYVDKSTYITYTKLPDELEERREIYERFEIENPETATINNVDYLIVENKNENESIPLFRLGYVYHRLYQNELCVSPLNGGFSYLEKMLKCNAELDIIMAYHAYPQKLRATQECTNPQCIGGHVNGAICPSCNGSGLAVSTTAMDTIEVNALDLKEWGLALDGLVAYISPSTDIVKFQSDYLDKLKSDFMKNVFHSDSYLNPQIGDTATGKIIDQSSLYGSLKSYLAFYNTVWYFTVDMVANIIDRRDGLIITTYIDPNFIPKTINQLFDELKMAKDAGASPEIIQQIEERIFATLNPGDNQMLLKRKVISALRPFPDKLTSEANGMIATLPIDNYYRVKYTFFMTLINELEAEVGPELYMMPADKVSQMLDAKIANIQSGLKSTPPAFPA